VVEGVAPGGGPSPREERGGRADAVEVIYDGLDGPAGKIAWRLQPLTVEAATIESTVRLEQCKDWRPECYPLQNPEIQSNLELVDTFPFRSQGRGKRAGPPPPVRPQPARVARDLALALKIQAEIDREGLTYREVATRHGCSRKRVCRLLLLTRLAPEIQDRVARMTTTTASEPLDREALEWVADVMDWSEQRDRFQKTMVCAGSADAACARILY
jgi:hypothetical protein